MDRIGTALIGLGRVSRAHAEALASLPRSRFIGAYDESSARVRSFSDQYNVRPYGTFDDLLADPDVQMVDICTPHTTHAKFAISAATSGRHVLVEKPMASSLADCDAMIEAAAESGVRLAVISQRRWYEPVRRVRQAILERRIGEPALGTLTLLGWRGEDYYRLDPWRGTWTGEGGGVLVNQASHHLDLLQWFMGPVQEVFGYWANLNHPYIEVEDTSVAVLRFHSGGLGAIVLSNSQKPGLYGRIHIHGRNGASVGVQTETGSSFVAGVTSRVKPPFNDIWTIPGESKLINQWRRQDREGLAGFDLMTHYHRLQIQDFLEAIGEGRESLVSGEEGRKSVELFTAIYHSMRDQAPVRLPIAPNPGRRVEVSASEGG